MGQGGTLPPLRCQGHQDRDRFTYDCNDCHYQFSVTANTIFHDFHLGLWKWFLATYLMTESKKGMSANQMKRTLNISYQTAWYLCHRIRKAMAETDPAPLCGTVECDKTYIGGKRRHVGSGYVGNKTMVLGALQRGGDLRLKVEKRATRASKELLHTFVADATVDETEAIYTDDNPDMRGSQTKTHGMRQ